MGMFDKDQYYGYPQMEKTITQGRPFILHKVEVRPGFPLEDGEVTDQCILTISNPDQPDKAFEVSTLGGAIVARAQEAEPGDFPAVVRWDKVPSKNAEKGFNDATVLKLVKNHKVDLKKAEKYELVSEEPTPF